MQWNGDIPVWIVATAFDQIANAADVVSSTVFIYILELHLLPAHGCSDFKGLQDGDDVLTTTSEIVYLTAAWSLAKLLNEARHTMGVDVLPHLRALITKNLGLLQTAWFFLHVAADWMC